MKSGQWIILNDGRRIVLEDKEEICLTLYSCADAGQTFLVPYPSAGMAAEAYGCHYQRNICCLHTTQGERGGILFIQNRRRWVKAGV